MMNANARVPRNDSTTPVQPGLPHAEYIVPPGQRSVNAKLVVPVLLGLLVLSLGGCSTVGFYAQAATGQASLMFARRDVGEVIADPHSDPEVVRKLRLVENLLRYAEDELHLPVGGRYRSYVEIDGALLWSVVAAPEFSVDAVPRCYPVIGCAVYRGYFARTSASREAERLGVTHDVLMAEVAAYSTLGWFDDPILSSFLGYDEAALADLIFHELAHSVVYVAGDSAFNESFAGFVGNEGAFRWLGRDGGDAAAYRQSLASAKAYSRFLGEWRGRLADLYARAVGDAAKRQLKAELFAAMRRDYESNRERLGGGRYDAAMAAPFNNARMALISTYEDNKPRFARLFSDLGEDWPAFYAAVGKLAVLPEEERWETFDR